MPNYTLYNQKVSFTIYKILTPLAHLKVVEKKKRFGIHGCVRPRRNGVTSPRDHSFIWRWWNEASRIIVVIHAVTLSFLSLFFLDSFLIFENSWTIVRVFLTLQVRNTFEYSSRLQGYKKFSYLFYPSWASCKISTLFNGLDVSLLCYIENKNLCISPCIFSLISSRFIT